RQAQAGAGGSAVLALEHAAAATPPASTVAIIRRCADARRRVAAVTVRDGAVGMRDAPYPLQ
ncbi:MAG TPA: hypothetical protein PLV68_06955, partial [Ilumatobacteraceae bacterium]|nr:hypothetical protein [Ilumatobacteraceae bacterium]